MSFSATLKEIVDSVGGAVSAAVIGLDGIPVEDYTIEKMVNLDDFVAEASAVINAIKTASGTLNLGETEEFSISLNKCILLFRRINKDYYIALVLKPGGNTGKGRFVIKTAVSRLEKDF